MNKLLTNYHHIMDRKVLIQITVSLALFGLLISLTAFPTVVLAQSQQQPTMDSSSSAAPNLNSAKLLNRLEKNTIAV
jgi:hypothetical protein